MKYAAFKPVILASRKSSIKYFTLLKAVSAVLIVGMGLGCSPVTKNVLEEQENSDIHVAFAGGGWRAHTGHAAWVMSLLQSNEANGCTLSGTSGNPDCLKAAFSNVKTISGNSGGSWFSTMLMYDPDFVNEITSKNAVEDWGSTDSGNPNQGWLGKQQNYFASFSPNCGSKHGADYLECILENYFSPSVILPTPNWSQFVQGLVYKGYNWQAYRNLNSNTHLPWAKDKTLLMAGTWLTNAVVLNDNNDFSDELFYQACPSPNGIKTDGDDGSWCLDRPNGQKISTPDVLPVTFSSLAENDSTLIAPAFIGTQATLFNLEYSGAYAFSTTPTKSNTLQSGNNKTDHVPVMWASAASSAAAGYVASYTVSSQESEHWAFAYHARNLALGFKVPNGTNQVAFVPDDTLDNISLDDLSTDRVIRVADGGALDNSGITQLIQYLQINKKDTNFVIVAFDDIQINDASDRTKYPSSDISYMFVGAPDSGVCVQSVCVQVPELTMVALDPTASTPFTKHTWTVVGPNGQPTSDSLHYYIYKVQTVANPQININGGSKGTLHIFASEFGCADTAPENNNDFPCYNGMLETFGPTLLKKPNNGTSAKTGFDFLHEVFGL
ncbi:MAG: hypothetical protein ACKVU0_05320 [Saprospiraceae bacterium]